MGSQITFKFGDETKPLKKADFLALLSKIPPERLGALPRVFESSNNLPVHAFLSTTQHPLLGYWVGKAREAEQEAVRRKIEERQ